MKYAMFFLAVTLFCLKQATAQTAYFNAPADKSIHGPTETIDVSFNITADADSVKLLLKGAGSQRFLDLSVDGDYSAEIDGLVAGNYKLYAYVFNSNLYTVSTLQFTIANGCCTVRTFADSAAGEVEDNDNGWELDMSNYDYNPYTFGFLKYNAIGETSVASITNKDSASMSVSNLSQLQLASLHDQSFSLFSSSNDLTKGRYGSAGIYGYATSDYENGGSGLSYEVSDSLGTSTIEQYSTGLDITAKNFNVSSDTVFVTSNNIVFSSQPVINGGLGLGEYSFLNGLSQDGSDVGLGGVGGFDAYFLPEEGDEGMGNGEFYYNTSGGYGGLVSSKYTDTTSQEAGIGFQNYAPNNDQYFQMYADNWSPSTYSNANIYGYSGPDGVGLSLNASDSSSHNENNGIQIYATGIDLNAKNVQLNYYPNNSDSSLILTTDALGNIVQRPFASFSSGSGYVSGGDFFVGNGLLLDGSQIGLGGSEGFDALYLAPGDSGQSGYGEFAYDNSGNSWTLASRQSTDSLTQFAGINVSTSATPTVASNFQQVDLTAVNISGTFGIADINTYAGLGAPGISLTVQDSLSLDENNGIQIYDKGMDLNAPNIQLNYFPNNPAKDLILTTDSVGNLVQKSFGSFFDAYGGVPEDLVAAGTGLTYDGASLGFGGTSGFDATYLGTDISNTGYGEFSYNSVNNSWGLGTYGQDSSNYQQAAFNFSITPSGSTNTFAQQYELLVGGAHDSFDSVSVSDLNVYSGDDGAGISLNVRDASTIMDNNGIQIYNNGIDLNAPAIQFNAFPNTPSMDSVLVTDSLGYLKQRAISSFANGHWYLSGNTTYDVDDSIGIGTNSPQSKLAVNGTVTALKVKVTQSGWPDYVFDSAYSLTSLKDLEKYLQQNKHLPEITSAADIEKNGLDLGDNQAALLKKVEELTLYIIKQNKEIDELKAQANKLKALEDKVNALISK